MKSKFKKVSLLFILFLTLIISLIFTRESNAMKYYETVDTTTGLVTASVLNVRQGPATTYKIVTQVVKNEYVRLFAKIGNWYVIQTDKDYIGAVSKDYIKLIYPTNNQNSGSDSNNGNVVSTSLTTDEQEVLKLINKERNTAGLSDLVIDDELQRVAKIKAQDMVDNNYFSHTSPIYGSPFEMLQAFKVSYRTAGENIAGNSTNSGAVNAWMGSTGHRENILNNAYNYTGIGVVSSNKYGKIYVQMFIGR